MEINLTVEDEIVIRMLRLYTENSFDETLDFSGLYYDEDEFLASLDRCKVAGLAYRMAVDGRLRKLPDSLFEALSERAAEYADTVAEAKQVLNNVLFHLRKQKIRVVVAGSMALRQLIGENDLLLDEIELLVERKTDLSAFETGSVRIRQKVKGRSFFDMNYSACLKINYADCRANLMEMAKNVSRHPVFNHKIVAGYLAFCSFMERDRFFCSESINKYFGDFFKGIFAVGLCGEMRQSA